MKICHLLLISALLLSSCQKKTISIEGLDLSAWKNDFFGCEGYREKNVGLMDANRQELLSFSETEIASTLGFPEKTELIDRSEKYYFYSLHGNPKCPKETDPTYVYLRVRFNSLGYSKEILILNKKI